MPNELLIAILQAVATALLLTCLWFVRSLFQRQADLEAAMNVHKLQTERQISDLKLQTRESLVRLETEHAAHQAD